MFHLYDIHNNRAINSKKQQYDRGVNIVPHELGYSQITKSYSHSNPKQTDILGIKG